MLINKKGQAYREMPKVEVLLITPFEVNDKGTRHEYIMKEREKNSIYNEKVKIRTYNMKEGKTKKQKELSELLMSEELEEVEKYEQDKELGGIARMIKNYNFNEEEYIREWMEEIAIMDQEAMLHAAQQKGEEKAIRNMIKKLQNKGFSFSNIMEITGLSKNQLSNYLIKQ